MLTTHLRCRRQLVEKKIFILSTTLLIITFAFVMALAPILSAQEKVEKQKKDINPIVIMETTMGTIELEMFAKETPKTVENFVGLVKKGYYNGIIFHRVIDNFMIQGGDPKGTGTGGESLWEKEFEDEFSPKLKHDGAGILSMANRGPNTNTSQFFITLVATPHLDGKHTVFGKVVKGLDIVKAIGKVETTKPGGKPKVDVVMKKVYLKGEKPKEIKKKK